MSFGGWYGVYRESARKINTEKQPGTMVTRCNYWGAGSGPTHDDNPDGRGDRVSHKVDSDPGFPQSFERVGEKACHASGHSPREIPESEPTSNPNTPQK